MKTDTGAGVAEADTIEETPPNIVDIAKKDELIDLGYRGDHLQSGWVASEMLGDDRVGPFNTLNELVVAVRERVQENGVQSDEFEAVDLDDGELDRIEAIIGEPDESFIDADPDEEALSDEPGEIELDADSKGNRYMPGMAPKVNQELTDAVGKYHAIKTERVALTRKETDAKDELKVVAARHANLFVPDPDNSDSMIYRAGDLILRKKITHEEKFMTEIADSGE